VKQARAQLEAAQCGVRGAKANFLPQLSISNGFTYNSPLLYDRNAFSFVALNGVREYSSLATTSLEVDTSGRLRAIYDRASANRHSAEVNVVISERDLQRDVSVAYYHLLLARQLASSTTENLQAAKDFESKVTQLVQGGEASEADLTKASLESALLERTAQAMTLEAEVSNHDLASFWTTDVATPLVLADDLDSLPVAPALPQLENPYLKRPEFQLFSSQIEGFRADARQARARMLPQLNLGFQYGIDSLHVTNRDRGYAGFVHLDIPVFDFLRARSEQRQFQSLAGGAEIEMNVGKRLFSKEYQDALSQVSGTYAQIPVAEHQVELARSNLNLSRLRFEGGEGTALEVVSAQSSLVQAQIDFYTTRANYLNAQSALKVASGQ
jgi:outer membrane protein TolC